MKPELPLGSLHQNLPDAIAKRKIVEIYRTLIILYPAFAIFPTWKILAITMRTFLFSSTKIFGISRDELYFALQKKDTWKKYFYPLITSFPCIKISTFQLRQTLAEEVLCLPIYADLKLEEVERIVHAKK